jgi:hypothetical protein
MKTSIINNLIEADIQRLANEVKIPKSNREARISTDAAQWLQAEESAFNALVESECIEITDLPVVQSQSTRNSSMQQRLLMTIQ